MSSHLRAILDDCFLRLGLSPERLALQSTTDGGRQLQRVTAAKSDPVDLDLRALRFAPLADLLDLYLLTSLCARKLGSTRILFPGISIGENPYLDPRVYQRLRNRSQFAIASPLEKELFALADPQYRVLAFLLHFGFIQTLLDDPARDKVLLDGYTQDLRDSLDEYGAIHQQGSLVLPLTPIADRTALARFSATKAIREWVSLLPQEARDAPIIASGQFARLFAFQLVENILDHAYPASLESEIGDGDPRGALTMRIVQPRRISGWLESLPPAAQSIGNHLSSRHRGVLEICVGDRGIGLPTTLREQLSRTRARVGLGAHVTNEMCVAYAMHALGSSKPTDLQWGGAHALHRVLNSVLAADGVLVLRTDGMEYVYDGESAEPTPLGVVTKHMRPVSHPFGTQLYGLIPLTPTRRVISTTSRARSGVALPEKRSVRVIAAGAYLQSNVLVGEATLRDKEQLIGLTNGILEEPPGTVIAYDFSDSEFPWTEDALVVFLESQTRALHSRLCIGLNVDPVLAEGLRTRESLDPEAQETAFPDSPIRLFRALADEQRLFPVRDTTGIVWWLGLGRNRFDGLLNSFMNRGYLSAQAIELYFADIVERDRVTAERDRFISILRSNTQLFGEVAAAGAQSDQLPRRGWSSLARRSLFDMAAQRAVAQRLPELLRELGCLLDGKRLYRLPTKPECTRLFYRTTPLLQDPTAADQIAQWLSAALLRLIPGEAKTITLVGVTAPVELLARKLSEHLPNIRTMVLNLGHYWAIDEDHLVRGKEWGEPAVAVLLEDVEDSLKTRQEVLALLRERGFLIAGVLTLLRLVDREKDLRALFWDPQPGGETLPQFVLAERVRPSRVLAAIAEAESGDAMMTWVEPFSLETFSYESLARTRSRRSPSEALNRERIELIERANALRSGHYAFGSHHFRVTVSFGRLFGDDAASGSICAELLGIINDQRISHVLLPLSSHIGGIVPRLLSTSRVWDGRSLDVTYCVASQVLTGRRFYHLPERIVGMIREAAVRRPVKDAKPPLRILIVDDAIASGRSLETLVRAISRACRDAVDQPPSKVQPYCPVEAIVAYAVLDRQGRARRGLFQSLRELGIAREPADQGSAGERRIVFGFRRWVELELPVTDRRSCDQCAEYAQLRAFLTGVRRPADVFVARELKLRQEQLQPLSTDSPSFVELSQTEFVSPVKYGEGDFFTVEGLLLHVLSLVSNGYPLTMLVRQLGSLAGRKPRPPEVERVLEEIGRALFRDWQRLQSQWAAEPWAALVSAEVSEGSALARTFLAEAGRCLGALGHNDSLLENLFAAALVRLANLTGEETNAPRRRANLFTGLALFGTYFHLNSGEAAAGGDGGAVLPQRLLEEVEQAAASTRVQESGRLLQELLQVFRFLDTPNTFLQSYLTVLDHTVRAGRRAHANLLPSELEELCAGKELPQEGRRHLAATLREFRICLSYCFGALPSIFSEKAHKLLPSLEVLLDDLTRVLEEPWGGRNPHPRAVDLACYLINQFPNQETSSIAESLRSTVIRLRDILSRILSRGGLRVAGPSLTVIDDSKLLDSVWILGSAAEDVEELIANFTASATVDHSFAPDPRVVIQLSLSRGRGGCRAILLKIFTNLAPRNVLSTRLQVGPGFISSVEPALDLFGVDLSLEGAQSGPDGHLYEGAIRLVFALAFPPEVLTNG